MGGFSIQQAFTQQVRCEGTLVGNGLRHCAQPKEPTHGMVVYADHGDVLGTDSPCSRSAVNAPKAASSQWAKTAVGFASAGDEFSHCPPAVVDTWPGAHHKVRVDGEVVFIQCTLEATEPRGLSHNGVFIARENGQVPMAQPQQVLGCLPGRMLVIDTYIVPRNISHTHAGYGHPAGFQRFHFLGREVNIEQEQPIHTLRKFLEVRKELPPHTGLVSQADQDGVVTAVAKDFLCCFHGLGEEPSRGGRGNDGHRTRVPPASLDAAAEAL